MYIGEYEVKLDKVNRLLIPSKLKKGLTSIVLTFIDEDTLIIMDSNNFNPNYIINKKVDEEHLNTLLKYIELNSYKLNVDVQGRTSIPKIVLDKISFKSDVLVVGRGEYFILTNKTKYLEEKRKIEEEIKNYFKTEEGKELSRKLKYD